MYNMYKVIDRCNFFCNKLLIFSLNLLFFIIITTIIKVIYCVIFRKIIKQIITASIISDQDKYHLNNF